MFSGMIQSLSIPGIFVTGTDTGVGKTVVAGAIANWFMRRQKKVAVCKIAATGCVPRALSDHGRLCLFTTVANRPPGYSGEVPFGFGVVELPEGMQLIARLTETDPERLAFGMPMRLTFVPVHVDDEGREVITYAFAPDAG